MKNVSDHNNLKQGSPVNKILNSETVTWRHIWPTLFFFHSAKKLNKKISEQVSNHWPISGYFHLLFRVTPRFEVANRRSNTSHRLSRDCCPHFQSFTWRHSTQHWWEFDRDLQWKDAKTRVCLKMFGKISFLVIESNELPWKEFLKLIQINQIQRIHFCKGSGLTFH